MRDYRHLKRFIKRANDLREGKGSFINRLFKRLAFFAIYFFVATAFFELLGFESLAMESRGLQMAGTVLGVFLALNLNTGYGKWEKAIGLLGALKSSCIGLVSAGFNTYMPKEWKRDYINTVAVIPEAIKAQVSGESHIEKYLALLDDKSAQELELAKDKSLWVSTRLTLYLNEAMENHKMVDDFYSVSEAYRDEMLKSAGGFVGMTLWPSPIIVSRMTEIFITIYMFFLPWTAAVHFSWFGPILCVAVGGVLLAMDLAGKDLSHPFDKDSLGAVPFEPFCDFVTGEILEQRKNLELGAKPAFNQESSINSSSFPS